MTVLPTTKERRVNNLNIASISLYENRNFTNLVGLGISGNVANSIYSYGIVDKSYSMVYPQQNIGEVLTGYVYLYQASSVYPSQGLFRYFIFSDGTGVTLDFHLSSYDTEALAKDSDFTAFKKHFGEEYHALSDRFIFTQTSTS